MWLQHLQRGDKLYCFTCFRQWLHLWEAHSKPSKLLPETMEQRAFVVFFFLKYCISVFALMDHHGLMTTASVCGLLDRSQRDGFLRREMRLYNAHFRWPPQKPSTVCAHTRARTVEGYGEEGKSRRNSIMHVYVAHLRGRPYTTV